MQIIKYDDDSQVISVTLPEGYTAPTEVTVVLLDTAGDTLDSGSATVYDADTLSSAAAYGATSIAITAEDETDKPSEGDVLLIAASADGPEERCVVEYATISETTCTIYLTQDLRHAHSSGAAVSDLTYTYTLDTSDTDTWMAGKDVRVVWTPDTDDVPWTELYTVLKYRAALQLKDAFRTLYPRHYASISDSFAGFYTEALRRLRARVGARAATLDLLVDSDILRAPLVEMIRLLVDSSNGDDTQDATDAFVREWEYAAASPIWIDEDQDQARDDEEHSDRGPVILSRGSY